MSNDFKNGKISPEAEEILKNKGINPEILKSQNSAQVLSSLNKNDAEKINNILNDKEALEKILSSDRAKAIIKNFFGGAK